MYWLSLTRLQELKLTEVKHHFTLGSSESNSICLKASGLLPLHGKFIAEGHQLFFHDFSQRSKWPMKLGGSLLLGDWTLQVESWESLWNAFSPRVFQAFKAKLRDHAEVSLERLLTEMTDEYFLGSQLPYEFEVGFRARYQELSLLGPIEALFEDEEITDILIKDYRSIWVEKKGALKAAAVKFTDAAAYQVYIENLMSQLAKVYDESSPFVDFTFSDGSRGHLIGPPLTEGDHCLSIRKFPRKRFNLKSLLDREMFSPETLNQIRNQIHAGENILISGATGSGKTTLLRALLQDLPKEVRLVVIEDTPELVFHRENSVFLRSRKSLQNLQLNIGLRSLLQNALRMRPDRIVVGEVRGEEALDLIHAMNTGHRGSMGTIHANSCQDALLRLQGLIRMSSAALSEEVTRDLVVRNIQTVLHCDRDSQNKRILAQFSRVCGMEGSQIILEEYI